MSSNTFKQPKQTQRDRTNPRLGAPKGNKNAKKHGLYAAKSALSEWGQCAIDGRSALGRALTGWKADVVRDLGGLDNLSAQQLSLLDVLTRTKVMLDGVDNFILSQRSLVNRRKKALLPIVRERAALVDSFAKHLQALGLQKRQLPEVDLKTYLAEKSHERGVAN